jgi:acyl carrier protein
MIEIVRRLAREKNKLAEDGVSLSLDSMSVIDFVLALEEASGVEISNSELKDENFRTVDDVARLLERLRAP